MVLYFVQNRTSRPSSVRFEKMNGGKMRKILFMSGFLLVLMGLAMVVYASDGVTTSYTLQAAMLAPQAAPETGCLKCHTNEALLQELAEEEPEIPRPPSEGSG